MKSIVLSREKEEEVKGIAIVIVNTGGGMSFQEMLADMTFATNRLHQLGIGKVQCNAKSFPEEWEGGEISSQKANDIAIGRLLIKQENRLARDRSLMRQNAAFATARAYATNADQKPIQKEWEEKEVRKISKREGQRSSYRLQQKQWGSI